MLVGDFVYSRLASIKESRWWVWVVGVICISRD